LEQTGYTCQGTGIGLSRTLIYSWEHLSKSHTFEIAVVSQVRWSEISAYSCLISETFPRSTNKDRLS
ncbi:unnamed protein product, partial [Mycena citricolor]